MRGEKWALLMCGDNASHKLLQCVIQASSGGSNERYFRAQNKLQEHHTSNNHKFVRGFSYHLADTMGNLITETLPKDFSIHQSPWANWFSFSFPALALGLFFRSAKLELYWTHHIVLARTRLSCTHHTNVQSHILRRPAQYSPTSLVQNSPSRLSLLSLHQLTTTTASTGSPYIPTLHAILYPPPFLNSARTPPSQSNKIESQYYNHNFPLGFPHSHTHVLSFTEPPTSYNPHMLLSASPS